jgi:hypothetical protein
LSDETGIILVKDGRFSKSIKIEKPVLKSIVSDYWYQDVFLAPGYSLHFSLDAENIEKTYKISGKGSEENRIFDAINLFGGNGWDSKVAKSYQVYAIPTFVLIDYNGKIIDAQAPRPSSDKIRPKLDGLLAGKSDDD